MLIDYLNGGVGTDQMVQATLDILSNFVPADALVGLYSQLSNLYSVVRDGVTGQVGLGTVGTYIADLATNICSLLPQCSYSTIISILWDLSSLL